MNVCSGMCDPQYVNRGQVRVSGIKPKTQFPEAVSHIEQVRQKYFTLSKNQDWFKHTEAYTIDSSSSIYYGPTKQNKPHGFGRLTNIDGSLYEGDFRDGVAEGDRCLYIYPDGSYYQGSMSNSRADGYGKFVYKDKRMIYEGSWKGDQPHGQGIQQFYDGSRYKGDFVRGLKEGSGVFVWSNEDKYDGEFREGMMFGRGTFESPELAYMYDGEWENNLKNGEGIERFKDGTVISCHFENDQRIGDVLVEKQGVKYKGKESGGIFMYS